MKKVHTRFFFLLLIFICNKLLPQSAVITAFAKSIEKEKQTDYTGAIKIMTDLNDSTTYEVILRLGWLNYKAGFKKRSMQYYTKAIDMKPDAIEPRLGFGFPAYQLEDFTDLTAQDKKILEMDPNNKGTNANLGLIYYYDKQYKKALPHFQKIVDLYPFDYDNNLMLGWTYARLGQNADAEKHFRVTLLYSPTDASAKEGLSNIGKSMSDDDKLVQAFAKSYELANKSDYKSAIEALKEVYDKSSYFINLRLGWLSHAVKAVPEALSYYKIAMDLKPGAVEPKLGIVIPLETMGNKNELKTLYSSILTVDPQNTFVHYKLGVLLYEARDYAAASEHFNKVLKLFPFDYSSLLMLGWTNYQLGKADESKDYFNKVLCIAPGDPSATKGLAPKTDEQKKPEQKMLIRAR